MADETPAAPPAPPAPPKKSNLPKIIIGCVIVAVLVVGGTAGGFIYFMYRVTQRPVTATNRFLEQLGKGQTQDAYESTSPTFKSATTLDELDAFAMQMQLDSSVETTFSSRSIKNDVANISGTIKRKSGESTITVTLVYYDEDWHVEHLNIK